ncbi:fido domain-containing protein [Obelidium mucronatum]|nr:fido domain-containing protein [Obelidium mucronatum]
MTKYINVNFELPDRNWWSPDYVTQPAVETLVLEMEKLSDRVKHGVSELHNDYLLGFDKFFRSQYLLESLVGEGILDDRKGATMELVEELLNPSSTSKTAEKVRNLNEAVNFLFPNTIFLPEQTQAFTPQLAINLHAIIGKDIISNAGCYRTKYACPSQEDYIYLAPHLIQKHMESLFAETNKSLAVADGLIGRVKVVASFLTGFLHIHPFSNGNGRVARLLVSALIGEYSIVLFLIAGTSSGRETLLECLRESRKTTPFTPVALARLLLENMQKFALNACTALDL